jgi:hypothetical protein
MSGTLDGPAFHATVIPGGEHQTVVRADGIGALSVSVTIETLDGALIAVRYAATVDYGEDWTVLLTRGKWPDVLPVRSHIRLLTCDARYSWLNRLHCLGVGEVRPSEFLYAYDMYAVRGAGGQAVPTTVIVLGGGIGSLSAAHELSERGFSVRVLEMRDVPGGKARSVVVPSTVPRQNVGGVHLGRLASPVRRDLPGEHGFRFFPRFYKHVIDTMERTPYRGSRSVADNLVDTTGTVFTRFGRRPLKLPTTTPTTVPELFTLVRDLASLFGHDLGIAPEDFAFFGERIWQILTSCPGVPHQRVRTDRLVGVHRRRAATGPVPEILRDRLHPLGRRCPGEAGEHKDDRRHVRAVLLQPGRVGYQCRSGAQRSDERRVDRSVAHVPAWARRGLPAQHTRALDRNGRWRRARRDRESGRTSTRSADYCVSALPVEVMATLVTDRVVRADPSLANVFALSESTGWVNGIQFYLDDDAPIGPATRSISTRPGPSRPYPRRSSGPTST